MSDQPQGQQQSQPVQISDPGAADQLVMQLRLQVAQQVIAAQQGKQ